MIYIASDHAGFEVKEYLKKYFDSLTWEYIDIGPSTYIKDDDYPDYAESLIQQLGLDDLGILLCDTGIGMSIAANRHKNIRAALCSSIFDAMRARSHNNANILVMGAETNDYDTIKAMVKVFFDTTFSDEERHIRRVNKLG